VSNEMEWNKQEDFHEIMGFYLDTIHKLLSDPQAKPGVTDL